MGKYIVTETNQNWGKVNGQKTGIERLSFTIMNDAKDDKLKMQNCAVTWGFTNQKTGKLHTLKSGKILYDDYDPMAHSDILIVDDLYGEFVVQPYKYPPQGYYFTVLKVTHIPTKELIKWVTGFMKII